MSQKRNAKTMKHIFLTFDADFLNAGLGCIVIQEFPEEERVVLLTPHFLLIMSQNINQTMWNIFG